MTTPCDNEDCQNVYAHFHSSYCTVGCDHWEEEKVNVEESSTEYTQVTTAEWTALNDKAFNESNAKEQYLRERDEARRKLEALERVNAEMNKLTTSQDRQIRQARVDLNQLHESYRKVQDKLRKSKRAIKNLSGAWK